MLGVKGQAHACVEGGAFLPRLHTCSSVTNGLKVIIRQVGLWVEEAVSLGVGELGGGAVDRGAREVGAHG